MEIQLTDVFKAVLASTSKFLSTAWGKLTSLMTFFASVGLADIAGILHFTLGLVAVDMAFGIAVTVKRKGWSHILSSRLRDSLVKALFYLIIIIALFLIEKNVVDGYALTAKLAFSVICGTELWSIMANMLVLMPNIPVLKMLSKMLEQEIAKKTGVDEAKVKEELESGENKE